MQFDLGEEKAMPYFQCNIESRLYFSHEAYIAQIDCQIISLCLSCTAVLLFQRLSLFYGSTFTGLIIFLIRYVPPAAKKYTSAHKASIHFVTEKENNAGSAIGLEYQILDDALHPDAKLGSIGNRTLGSLYDLIPAVKENRARHKIGDWNRGMIKVTKDGTVSHYLNGWKMLEYKRGEQYFYALVARSKYANWPNFGMASKGRLLLQDHGNEVSFRSLKMQILQ